MREAREGGRIRRMEEALCLQSQALILDMIDAQLDPIVGENCVQGLEPALVSAARDTLERVNVCRKQFKPRYHPTAGFRKQYSTAHDELRARWYSVWPDGNSTYISSASLVQFCLFVVHDVRRFREYPGFRRCWLYLGWSLGRLFKVLVHFGWEQDAEADPYAGVMRAMDTLHDLILRTDELTELFGHVLDVPGCGEWAGDEEVEVAA